VDLGFSDMDITIKEKAHPEGLSEKNFKKWTQ
jgi:hypothetical protein